MDATASPVDLIEEWRRKASIFSSTDRLGNLISRSLEVLKGLARKELSLSDLEYALESLEMERTLALKHDKARDTVQVRSLMYGVIESIGLSVNAMIANDRIMTSEESAVEDPLTSQMDTSNEEMHASTPSGHHKEPANSRPASSANQPLDAAKRRSASSECRSRDSSVANSLTKQNERAGGAKRTRLEDREGSTSHQQHQPQFAPAPSSFVFGEEYRLPVAPSSSNGHVKEEDEFMRGVIKEENISPEDHLVEQQVYDSSQYTQWCSQYSSMAPAGPSTSHGGAPSTHFGLPPIAYAHGMAHLQDFANSVGVSATAHMYEGLYGQGTSQGLNRSETHHSSPSKSDDGHPKPFPCDECGKTFASAKWRHNHVKNVHAADKSKFTCPVCGMCFTDRSNQRRHIRRQHELRCSVCEEKFDNKASFDEHIWVVHGMRHAPPLPQLPQQ